MAQVQLAARIDARVKEAMERICEVRGLKMNRFVEDAIIDKLEELEDIEDLKSIRHEPTLSVVLKDLGFGLRGAVEGALRADFSDTAAEDDGDDE